MTYTINKYTSLEEVKMIIKKVLNKKKSKSLKRHFGKSKTIIDAVEFQKNARSEWD